MEKTIRIIVFGFIVALIIIDIYLVKDTEKATFSLLIKNNKPEFIWLTFLFGGLVSKIFYNRKTKKKIAEKIGATFFLIITTVLFFYGGSLTSSDNDIVNQFQLPLLIGGGFSAIVLWPQYED